MANHTHKSTETRDRLRTRLNQRKEKTPDVNKENDLAEAMNNLSMKPKPAKIAALKASQSPYAQCMHDLHILACPTCSRDIVQFRKAIIRGYEDVKKKDNKNSKIGNIKLPEQNKFSEGFSSLSTSSLNSIQENNDARDIDDLIHFIEGNKPVDKVALAQKKAAKKARQKQRKDEERIRKEEEEEAKRREEERIEKERIREQERQKALELARQQAEELKKNKKTKSKKNKKKNNESQPASSFSASNDVEMMEESIPALVTIKRVVESKNSAPLVTITLKGQTPDQDKLLYTLVNGSSNEITTTAPATATSKASNINTKTKGNNSQKPEANESKKSKKKNKNANASNSKHATSDKNEVSSNELCVTLSIDKSFRKNAAPEVKSDSSSSKASKKKKAEEKAQAEQPARLPEEFDIPSLRLPPGITITKVNGPINHKNCKATNGNGVQNSNGQAFPSANKSGVIVVDTEKLIQQSMNPTTTSKKSKKKKKNKQNIQVEVVQPAPREPEAKPKMVTLKNPIFHTLQTKLVDKNEMPVLTGNEQASITKCENGMVTIRRPRCVPMANENEISSFLGDLKPVVNTERAPPHFAAPGTMPNGQAKARTPFNPENYVASQENASASGVHGFFEPNCEDGSGSTTNPPVLSAHDILWGLPGIEITKVNKNSPNYNLDSKKCEQTADVSIIPTSTNGEKFHFDKDDWPYGEL